MEMERGVLLSVFVTAIAAALVGVIEQASAAVKRYKHVMLML